MMRYQGFHGDGFSHEHFLGEAQRDLEENDKALNPVIEECKDYQNILNENFAGVFASDEHPVDRLDSVENLIGDLPAVKRALLQLKKILTEQAEIKREASEAEEALPYEDTYEAGVRYDFQVAQGY
ncbi:hypothetical protein [Candidatus Liberibacter sp.]|uniref:hypothetical protein n=1 Tax=Candidatus Liberibacter sp. TaxID=34022 RepID=UPI0015F6FF6B|nr:hypothetical protein [Candidatus Liberibacter sp.]MBA5724598.1 hypothetical protein [Candidatus Liberibacter sp.]